MTFWLAFSAALLCALCNGIASVLQKEGADSEKPVVSLDAHLLIRLIRQVPYFVGTFLDICGGILTLVAVHFLPLFLVQSVIATNIAITFTIERLILKRRMDTTLFYAVALVLVGVVLVALTASPEQARSVSSAMQWGIALGIVPLALIGGLCSKTQGTFSALSLAALSGIAFGATALSGRGLVIPHTFWHILGNPLLYAFIVYGLLALLLFTIGLQRTSATVLSTMMVIFETLVPAILGIVLFGDRVKSGSWPLAILGIGLTVCGVTILSLNKKSAGEYNVPPLVP